MNDTICAPATAAGDAGIAIIRISGADALKCMNAVFKKKTPDYTPRMMYLGEIYGEGELVDTALGVYFPAPNSYTGEDVCELQCHGGRMAAALTMRALIGSGARLAEPGEFSKRAFLNGKMDVTQAEAVQELIGSLSERGARISARSLRGDLKDKVNAMQDALTDVIAAIEAGIEYPEEDITESEAYSTLPEIIRLADEANGLASTYESGRLVREGISIAIAGRPNVGKSSLLNAILGEQRSIVTGTAGTTRDTVSEYYDLRSIPVRFTDTAGIRETDDDAERQGVERSHAAVEQAGIVLLLIDASERLSEEDRALFDSLSDKKVMVVLNKTDIARTHKSDAEDFFGTEITEICAKDGSGIDALLDGLFERLCISEQRMEGVTVTNLRQRTALCRAAEALTDAADALTDGAPLDCASIDLADARNALGEITGSALTEDIIDRIFEKFCLGK